MCTCCFGAARHDCNRLAMSRLTVASRLSHRSANPSRQNLRFIDLAPSNCNAVHIDWCAPCSSRSNGTCHILETSNMFSTCCSGIWQKSACNTITRDVMSLHFGTDGMLWQGRMVQIIRGSQNKVPRRLWWLKNVQWLIEGYFIRQCCLWFDWRQAPGRNLPA